MSSEILGWIISFWDDTSQIQRNNREEMQYLSWSPYDRVTIKPASDFSDFFNIKRNLDWNGAVQHLHLIPIGECSWSPGINSLISANDSFGKPYGFYCIVTARFSQQFQSGNAIRQSIGQHISKYFANDEMRWQGFQSLGAEDYVCIFLSNSIADLARAVKFVRGLTYTNNYESKKVFNSVYSFTGLNNPAFDGAPGANLFVRIQPKSGYTLQGIEKVVKAYCNKVFEGDAASLRYRRIFSGKGYLEIEIPNHAKILNCFYNKNDAVFNGQFDFYEQYVESSRTYWYITDEEENQKGAGQEDIGELDIIKQKEFRKHNFENDDVHPVSSFIIREYERMINSQRCLWWKGILQRQYEMYSVFVREYSKEGNKIGLCALNNMVQTVLLHINQATAPIYEVPYHNYYYSGSYNDVLRMYYGIIGSIFNLAYKLPRAKNTLQHEIVYCVDFEAAVEVHSNMYTLKNDDRRFVIFHLPYDAFMQFDQTVKLLLHEVFHYISPYDRVERNKIFMKEWIVNVFWQYVAVLEKQGLSDESCQDITEYFFDDYDNICRIIQVELENQLDAKILNDFTTGNKIRKLRNIPEKICELLHKEVSQEFKSIFEASGNYFAYQEIYPQVFAEINLKFYEESIKRIAGATKEAFCDLNMIYILNLSILEYLRLIFGIFQEKYEVSEFKSGLDKLMHNENTAIDSFGLRIGMVLDYYYFEEFGIDEIEKCKEQFDSELQTVNCNDSAFKLFYQAIARYYDQYLHIYKKERLIFRELFLMQKGWFGIYKAYKYEEQNRLKKISAGQKQIADYISAINDFVNIEVDSDLINNKIGKLYRVDITKIKKSWQKQRQYIYTLGEYVEQCCNTISDWGNNTVWYRGVCDENYLLLPSLFRHLNKNSSLYAEQARLLKEAYYLTISDSALWTERLKTKLEHMAYLQHYGMPTSLLDFSEDILMALHFALNPDRIEDLKKIETYASQPKIVMFNPVRYDEAIRSLKNGRPFKHDKNTSPIVVDVHEELVRDYCVYNMSPQFINGHAEEFSKEYEPNPRLDEYPQPIVVRRANERIMAQKGTFMAYNLSAKPHKEGKDIGEYYNYLSLEKIQENYYELLEKNGRMRKDGEFIREIYINKLAIPTLKKQLKDLNITTARVYPEHFRIFAEHMEKQ